MSSALVGVLALPLPFGTAAANRALSPSLSSLTRSQKSICAKLLTTLRWCPWMCFVIFILVAAESPALLSGGLAHCFYFDDSQVPSNSTSRIELAFFPNLLVCLLFFSFIRIVSQHIFIYCLLWSRQCSRHQGFKVEKWTWPSGRFLRGLFPPPACFISGIGSAWTEASLYYPTLHRPLLFNLLHSVDSFT